MRPVMDWMRDLNSDLISVRREDWQYIFAFGLDIILMILFAFSIVMNFYQISRLVVTSNHEIAAIQDTQHKITNSAVSPELTNIHEWHLFGSLPQIVTTIASGNFSLIGIEYPFLDPSSAKAIISYNSGDEGIYRVGDQLPQGAIIKKIEPQQVTLLVNGAIEILPLKWDYNDTTGAAANPQAASDDAALLQETYQTMQQSTISPLMPPELKQPNDNGSNDE